MFGFFLGRRLTLAPVFAAVATKCSCISACSHPKYLLCIVGSPVCSASFCWQVRVRNLTYEQPFSPPLIVAHTSVSQSRVVLDGCLALFTHRRPCLSYVNNSHKNCNLQQQQQSQRLVLSKSPYNVLHIICKKTACDFAVWTLLVVLFV